MAQINTHLGFIFWKTTNPSFSLPEKKTSLSLLSGLSMVSSDFWSPCKIGVPRTLHFQQYRNYYRHCCRWCALISSLFLERVFQGVEIEILNVITIFRWCWSSMWNGDCHCEVDWRAFSNCFPSRHSGKSFLMMVFRFSFLGRRTAAVLVFCPAKKATKITWVVFYIFDIIN